MDYLFAIQRLDFLLIKAVPHRLFCSNIPFQFWKLMVSLGGANVVNWFVCGDVVEKVDIEHLGFHSAKVEEEISNLE